MAIAVALADAAAAVNAADALANLGAANNKKRSINKTHIKPTPSRAQQRQQKDQQQIIVSAAAI